MAYSNHNKYVSYPDWFGSLKEQSTTQTSTDTTIIYRGGGYGDGTSAPGVTGVVVTGSGNAVTSGILDGTTIVLNKDLTFLTENNQTLWELRLTPDGKEYLYANYDIVTLGGHTMYVNGDDSLNLPGLYDGIPIDSDTIYWETLPDGNKVLKAKFIEDTGVDASEVLSIVANAGYAKQTWVSERYSTIDYVNTSITELTKYVNDTFVTFENDEVITGLKTFTKGIQIGNPERSLIKINQLQDDVLYIDSNVVIRGGVTMYYEDGDIDLPSIKEEIGNSGYDGVTGLAAFDSTQFVIAADGTVSIIGGSTGLDYEALQSYLTSNSYATQSWVNEQGYASASSLSALQETVNNFLEGSDTDTIINKWKELEAFLEGLSESDNLAEILATKWTTDNTKIANWDTAYSWGDHASVGYALKSYVDDTFALYIPIAGYTNVTGEKNFTGGLRVNNSPSIYYDATNKYWKLEGDLLVTGGVSMYSDDSAFTPSTIMDAIAVDSTMYNEGGILGVVKASTTRAGAAMFDSNFFSVDDNGLVTLTNAPSSVSTLGSLLNVDYSLDATATVDRMLYQPAGSSTWTWKELTSSGVVGDYLPLSGGQMTGTIGTILHPVNKQYYVPAAGNFNYAKITEFETKCSFIGSVYDTSSLAWYVGFLARHASFISSGVNDANKYGMYLLAKMQSATTTLENTNLLWNIQINGSWGTDRFILDTKNWRDYVAPNGTFTINGGSVIGVLPALRLHIPNVNWSQFVMGTDGIVWLLKGDSQASEQSERAGLVTGYFRGTSIISDGGITMYSDIRKKQKLQDVELSLSQIANAPLIEHYYLSDQDKTTHVGSIAQYWAGLNDWFCKLDNEGYYTMEIQNAALASAISIARHLERYETKTDKKIRQLKKRISQLEDELENLKSANI